MHVRDMKPGMLIWNTEVKRMFLVVSDISDDYVITVYNLTNSRYGKLCFEAPARKLIGKIDGNK